MIQYKLTPTIRSESLQILFSKNNSFSYPFPHIDDEARKFVLKQLNEAIPSEWQSKILELYQRQRAIIEERKQLMELYRTTLPSIVEPILDSIPKDYPEVFL